MLHPGINLRTGYPEKTSYDIFSVTIMNNIYAGPTLRIIGYIYNCEKVFFYKKHSQSTKSLAYQYDSCRLPRA